MLLERSKPIPLLLKIPGVFSSKRQEEGLVFFGLRCYDIALERWLTPDPAGHVDGLNLYAYVLNSPFNRLDLFGLVSDQWGQERSNIFSSLPQYPTPSWASLSIAQIHEAQSGQRRILNIYEKGAKTDWFVICDHTHEMQFSAQELEKRERQAI